MGGGFVLLFWIILFGAFCAAWMAAFGVYCLGRDKGSKMLKWLSGFPLAVLSLIGIACISFVTIGLIRSMNPKHVFEWQFREPPTADVTDLRTSYWCFADSKQVFMAFHATQETVQRIVPARARRMKFKDYHERRMLDVHEAPSWWRSPTTTSEIYLANSVEDAAQSFASETTLITFEASTGTVMYFFQGVD